jgi:hypothetical protein
VLMRASVKGTGNNLAIANRVIAQLKIGRRISETL